MIGEGVERQQERNVHNAGMHVMIQKFNYHSSTGVYM